MEQQQLKYIPPGERTEPKTHRVFVYGSLKRYGHHHRTIFPIDGGLAGYFSSKYLGEALTQPLWIMWDAGSFPIVTDGGNTAIMGEVYEVTDPVLENADTLEGVPNFYDRIEVETTLGKVFMYYIPIAKFSEDRFWSQSKAKVIRSGYWNPIWSKGANSRATPKSKKPNVGDVDVIY